MKPRTGAIAVIKNDDRFLVIERSQNVTAPGAYCFPGGRVEPGEDESAAVQREIHEELGLADVQPIRCLWRCASPNGTRLVWWLTTITTDAKIVPDRFEVAEFGWWTVEQMLSDDRLLATNRRFLEAMARGEFTLTLEP